jgi:hypothetical protein
MFYHINKKKIEDSKGVIRDRRSKDNYLKKTDKKTNIELQNTTQKTGNIFVPLPWKQNFQLFSLAVFKC